MNAVRKLKYYGLVLAATAVTLGASASVSFAADAFSAGQKEELNKLIEAYIMDHPETIMKSVDQYRTKQQQQTAEDAQASLSKHLPALTAKDLPSTGPADADVTIVEFFDYNCGYCKRFFKDMLTLLGEDKKVRVVFKDLPILSPASDLMARYALAAHKQGKYFEMHQALMDNHGEQTETAFQDLAKAAGLDVEKLKKDVKDPSIEEALKADREMANELGIQGTPGLIIGDQIFRGYIGLDGIKQSLKEIREKNPSKK